MEVESQSEFTLSDKGEKVEAEGAVNGEGQKDMTSKDYYFDSYAHFGIHEVSYVYLKLDLNPPRL